MEATIATGTEQGAIDYLIRIGSTFIDLYLDTAVWLLAGLLLAAVVKLALPTSLVQRWLGGQRSGAVLRGALIGAPLPLCSCGVLPTAIGLRRAGASPSATVSFLIATPETGIDSIAVSYALLGPVMAIIRPCAAIISAISTGLLVLFSGPQVLASPAPAKSTESSCCGGSCSSNKGTDDNSARNNGALRAGWFHRGYVALVDLLDDIKGWLLFGLLLAALFGSFIEPGALQTLGGGIPAMLLMLAVSLPLYICATASTPIAAVMLASGISPGAVLVFMLVGPATNIGAIGLLVRELGLRIVLLYLSGIVISAILLGLGTNLLFSVDTLALPQLGARTGASLWLEGLAALILTLLMIPALRNRLLPKPKSSCSDACGDSCH